MFRAFQVSKVAAEKAKGFGLTVDAVTDMARKSAPYSKHDFGNRVYKDYALFIEDETVQGIWKLQTSATPIPKRTPLPKVKPRPEDEQSEEVEEEDSLKLFEIVCPDCNGDGGTCASCQDTGMVKGTKNDLYYRFDVTI